MSDYAERLSAFVTGGGLKHIKCGYFLVYIDDAPVYKKPHLIFPLYTNDIRLDESIYYIFIIRNVNVERDNCHESCERTKDWLEIDDFL